MLLYFWFWMKIIDRHLMNYTLKKKKKCRPYYSRVYTIFSLYVPIHRVCSEHIYLGIDFYVFYNK